MSERQSDTDIDQLLARIHRGLEQDGYYIDPRLTSSFTPAELSSISDNLAQAPAPSFVIAYPFQDNDQFGGSGGDLVARLHDAYPTDGVYLTTTPRVRVSEYESISLSGRQYGVPGQRDGEVDYQLLGIVRYEEPSSLGAAFARATDLLSASPEQLLESYDSAYEGYRDRNDLEDSSGTSTGSDTGGDGGDGGGGFDPTGLVVAALVVALIGALGLALIRRIGATGGLGRRGGASSNDGAFVLPPSAMAHIREAHDRNLAEQADDEVLALGRGIDRTAGARDLDRVSWQSALDHHDAAGRVLERRAAGSERPDVLDVVGALVLARRGADALAAAERGQPWTPRPDCYLDPLHGRATSTRAVTVDGKEVPAPLCATCRAALKKGTPPKILDVTRSGRAVHYFDSGSEPWASTGYGALDPDLIRALHGDRR